MGNSVIFTTALSETDPDIHYLTYQVDQHCPIISSPCLSLSANPKSIACRHKYKRQRYKSRSCDFGRRATHICLWVISRLPISASSHGLAVCGLIKYQRRPSRKGWIASYAVSDEWWEVPYEIQELDSSTRHRGDFLKFFVYSATKGVERAISVLHGN